MTNRTDIEAEAAACRAEIASAQLRLRAALRAGDETADIRRQIATAEARIETISDGIDAGEAHAAAALETELSDRAHQIAAAAIEDIQTRLAALQPPQAPTRGDTDDE